MIIIYFFIALYCTRSVKLIVKLKKTIAHIKRAAKKTVTCKTNGTVQNNSIIVPVQHINQTSLSVLVRVLCGQIRLIIWQEGEPVKNKRTQIIINSHTWYLTCEANMYGSIFKYFHTRKSFLHNNLKLYHKGIYEKSTWKLHQHQSDITLNPISAPLVSSQCLSLLSVPLPNHWEAPRLHPVFHVLVSHCFIFVLSPIISVCLHLTVHQMVARHHGKS